jgi:acetyl esterase/lipase
MGSQQGFDPMKRMSLCLSALLVFCAASASAQIGPMPSRRAEPSQTNIAYAEPLPANSKGHLLDIFMPKTGVGPVPLVIWTGGSAFLGDTGKETAQYIAPELLAAGFAVAGVSIRSSTQIKFPGQVHDIKAAIRFFRANAVRYGVDPKRIAIIGNSSGGWTTAMAALTGDIAELEGKIGTTGVSSAVQAAIAFYPPTDFLTMDEWAPTRCIEGNARPGPGMCHDDPKSPESLLIDCAIQTCQDKARAADPARYVSANDPPLMILHGRSDKLVPHQQGERLFRALAHSCGEAVFFSLPLAGHDPVWNFLETSSVKKGATVERAIRAGCAVSSPALAQPNWADVITFLKVHLK